ncbi:MAG: universal stress protein [Candidatus Binatus sp.]|uniref:universal stress protein n=1 Tax=Candidatus Binatus sp. TaxID=2811406 RepID=UPI00271C6A5B|nr:universal stress protein [Candidatus Binatus sp.]MDO8431020.1 universal stress protein [Candidatus Binatus sp.]
MAFPFRNILCPVDFDDNSLEALDTAANIVRQNDGTLFVIHIVPMIVPPAGMVGYVDLYKGQEETARGKLEEIARKRLAGIKYELLTPVGEPAGAILNAERKTRADLVVMATHGRRGFSRFLLGSVAELVLRESTCPVLTVRYTAPQKYLVGSWITRNPVTAAPEEKLSSVHNKMLEGGFRCVPILKDGVPVGIVTDRDIRNHIGYLEHTEAFKAMSEALITVTPSTTVRDAARLLRERKIGALPVVEDGKLIGVITTTDVLDALTAED